MIVTTHGVVQNPVPSLPDQKSRYRFGFPLFVFQVLGLIVFVIISPRILAFGELKLKRPGFALRGAPGRNLLARVRLLGFGYGRHLFKAAKEFEFPSYVGRADDPQSNATLDTGTPEK